MARAKKKTITNATAVTKALETPEIVKETEKPMEEKIQKEEKKTDECVLKRKTKETDITLGLR